MQKLLVKGNEAVAEAAIQAGCKLFFGYPITPSSEIIEYMARRLPEVGGHMTQAESEVSSIYMMLGAAGAGERCMTGTSGCGFSLMQEGMSFLAAYGLPAVVVDVARLGPALGNLDPSQGDYFQWTRGGGHGDYYNFVLAPSGVQEAADLMGLAFDLADQYRMPAVVAMDGVLGQMMEPVSFRQTDTSHLPPKTWAARGKKGGPKHDVVGYILDPVKAEQHDVERAAKYDGIRATEQRWEEIALDDADLVVVSFGTAGRVARAAVRAAREQGIKVGLIRPITLWPYPTKPIEAAIAQGSRAFMVAEMNMGQMVEDVRLTVNGQTPVYLHRNMGGSMPTTEELVAKIRTLAGEVSDHA